MSTILEVTADKIISRKDVERLLKELEREKVLALTGNGKLSYVMDYYLIRLTLQTGLRISEVAELKWKDIHEGFLIVRYGKGGKRKPHRLDKEMENLEQLLKLSLPPKLRKTTRKRLAYIKATIRAANRRTVYFGQQTQGLLNAYKAWVKSIGQPCGSDDNLFIGVRGPLGRYGIHERWNYWKRRVGLPANITFHSLRHFYGTMLLERGVSLAMIQKQLGHANAIYTSGYLHHTIEAREVLVSLL